jgi:very-short-patch-repair endonuclease
MTERNFPNPDTMLSRARRLRREATGPEKVLWDALRGERCASLKFRRQRVIGQYIVDFYCHRARLIVEVDGNSHTDRAASDAERSDYLQSRGLRILRVDNDDVLRDLDTVLNAILLAADIDPDRRVPESHDNNKPSP